MHWGYCCLALIHRYTELLLHRHDKSDVHTWCEYIPMNSLTILVHFRWRDMFITYFSAANENPSFWNPTLPVTIASQYYQHGPLTRYVHLWVAHAPGMPGTFSRHRLERKPLDSDPGMHHGTCVTHVPWCMPGSLTRSEGENVPGISGARAARNFTYLAIGPCRHSIYGMCAGNALALGDAVIILTMLMQMYAIIRHYF